jgi:O-antigen ligase
MLKTQMHNSLIHSMVQTGLLGSIPFVAGILLAWVLVFKSAFNLRSYSDPHRTRIVLAGGMLAFFSIRSVAESTAAFFGVDLLLLTPVLLYLWVVNQSNDRKA